VSIVEIFGPLETRVLETIGDTKVIADPRWRAKGSFEEANKMLKQQFNAAHRKSPSSVGEFQNMTPKQFALARMIYGKDSDFSKTGLLTPYCYLYERLLDPEGHIMMGESSSDTFLIVNAKWSPLFKYLREVTNAQFEFNTIDYIRDAECVWDYLDSQASTHASEALKTGVLRVNRKGYEQKQSGIQERLFHTKNFGKYAVPIFLFEGGKTATDYGRWLDEEAGIKDVKHSIYYSPCQEDFFAGALWIRRISAESELNGVYDNFLDKCSMRAVRLVKKEIKPLQ
jgi:hypothetical protein